MASLANKGLCIIPSLRTLKKIILSFNDSLALQIISNKTWFEREKDLMNLE